MKLELAIKGIVKILSGILLLGVLLFVPAGTFNYPGAWRMISILFVPSIIIGGVLLIKKPELLEKRLNQKETENEQKFVIVLSALIFIVSFLLCAFDYRFGWTKVSLIISVIGCVIFVFTYIGFAELLRENEYLSRTVEVQDNQKVVSTGLYGIVRHPMYSIIFWMFISMPIIIGSYVGLIPMILLPYMFVKRIKNEEDVLIRKLDGYEEYCEKIKYRLIPFIW